MKVNKNLACIVVAFGVCDNQPISSRFSYFSFLLRDAATLCTHFMGQWYQYNQNYKLILLQCFWFVFGRYKKTLG